MYVLQIYYGIVIIITACTFLRWLCGGYDTYENVCCVMSSQILGRKSLTKEKKKTNDGVLSYIYPVLFTPHTFVRCDH